MLGAAASSCRAITPPDIGPPIVTPCASFFSLCEYPMNLFFQAPIRRTPIPYFCSSRLGQLLAQTLAPSEDTSHRTSQPQFFISGLPDSTNIDPPCSFPIPSTPVFEIPYHALPFQMSSFVFSFNPPPMPQFHGSCQSHKRCCSFALPVVRSPC